MFEMSGRRLNDDDFPQEEETDSEEVDDAVNLENILGFDTTSSEDEDGEPPDKDTQPSVLKSPRGSRVAEES